MSETKIPVESDLVDLSEFTSIEDVAAQTLAQHGGDLDLGSLTSLSDAAAAAFAKHKGKLRLSGLKSLSDVAAESLAKHEGRLGLDGLTSLSDAAAESLAKHEGELWLGDKAKAAITAAKVRLAIEAEEFDEDAESEDDSGEEESGQSEANEEDEPASKTIILTQKIAEQFLADEDSVDLSEFTSIEDAAAQTLANHEGNLWLTGLTSLSDAAAESLAKHEGDLSLYGLTSLSDAAAESLGKLKGGLGLDGEAKKAVSRARRPLAKKLAEQFLADEDLSKLTKLDRLADLAKNGDLKLIADIVAGLDDPGLFQALLAGASISPEGDLKPGKPLKRFEHHAEFILLLAVAFMPKGVAVDASLRRDAAMNMKLNAHNVDIVAEMLVPRLPKLKGYDVLSDNGYSNLENLFELNPITAAFLARAEGELDLSGLESLSDAAAQALAKRKSELGFHLEGLTSLSDTAAAALAKYEGYLGLSCLESLSGAAAESLAKHKGELELDHDEVQEAVDRARERLASKKEKKQTPKTRANSATGLVRRFEFVDGASAKFWEIGRRERQLGIRWGRIGTNGQTMFKSFAAPDVAAKEQAALIAEKTRKGYREV